MTHTQIFVAGANALFVIACGIVSIRLLVLSRRTQQLPEFYLGAGFSAMVVSIPLMGISGLGRLSAGEIDFLTLALGLLLLWLSISTQAAFTWTAFRPRSSWAEHAVMTIAASEAVIVAGALHALGSAPHATPSFEAVYDWMFHLRIPLGIVYAWTMLESLQQYRMARRRNRIGLGDAVTTNRLLLWTLNSAVGVFTVTLSALLHLQKKGPFADPHAAAALGAAGLTGATLLYAAFMPPDWYLRWVRAQASERTSPETA
jgi:hypothetical protein